MAVPLIVGAVAPIIQRVVNNLFPDVDKKEELEKEITLALWQNQNELEKAAADIIKTEAASEHWMTSTWRPALMWLFILVLFNNFVISPYVSLATGVDVTLHVNTDSLPQDMWELLKIGVGGYIGGRTVEKAIKEYRTKDA